MSLEPHTQHCLYGPFSHVVVFQLFHLQNIAQSLGDHTLAESNPSLPVHNPPHQSQNPASTRMTATTSLLSLVYACSPRRFPFRRIQAAWQLCLAAIVISGQVAGYVSSSMNLINGFLLLDRHVYKSAISISVQGTLPAMCSWCF